MKNTKCPAYHHACEACSCRWECITPNCAEPKYTICPWDRAFTNGFRNEANVEHIHTGDPCGVCEDHKEGKSARQAHENGLKGLPNVEHEHAHKDACDVCAHYEKGKAGNPITNISTDR